jgi:acetoin utilization deacetylase AcuC-like enzyme
MATGFLYDERFLDHDAGAGHPERRERLTSTMAHLQSQDWFEQLHRLTPRIADEASIESVHSRDLVIRARSACEQELPFLDVMDTGVSRDSFDVALLAAGGAQELADRVIAGDVDNAFALCRPPGHHAERDLALGFCLFNNVAIAARHVQREHGLDKILILDWDVHHGNGTQHSFEDDPSVLYVSTHQYPYYPGTGAYSETGVGRGEGATLNCPMPAGAGDEQYLQVFAEKILPKIDAFAPEFVIVSAGFDAHVDDPLASICLSTEFFGWMSARAMEVADKHCDGRLISLLEGGYNIHTLPLCVDEHLQILSGQKEQQ